MRIVATTPKNHKKYNIFFSFFLPIFFVILVVVFVAVVILFAIAVDVIGIIIVTYRLNQPRGRFSETLMFKLCLTIQKYKVFQLKKTWCITFKFIFVYVSKFRRRTQSIKERRKRIHTWHICILICNITTIKADSSGASHQSSPST